MKKSLLLLCGAAVLAAAGQHQRRALAGYRPAPQHWFGHEPRFTDKNELLRPEGYRRWVFVGASLAMTYKEEGPPPARLFHNVYIHPRAFDEFEKTGKFPENTILMLEALTSSSQASINRDGHFEDRFVGLSAAVKNSSRFQEGWAYFIFRGGGFKSAAFPKERCWSCHKQHAARDNVFLQFYPVLRAQEEDRR